MKVTNLKEATTALAGIITDSKGITLIQGVTRYITNLASELDEVKEYAQEINAQIEYLQECVTAIHVLETLEHSLSVLDPALKDIYEPKALIKVQETIKFLRTNIKIVLGNSF